MELRLNLASRVYLDRRSVRRWLMLVGSLLIVWLAVDLLYGYRSVQQWRQVDAHLAELDNRLARERGGAESRYTPEKLTRLQGQIGAMNQIIVADQFRWTALLSRLEALLPENVAIRSLQPKFDQRSLQLTLVARDTAAMTELLDALLASDDLSQAFLLNHVISDTEDGGPVVTFSLLIREAF